MKILKEINDGEFEDQERINRFQSVIGIMENMFCVKCNSKPGYHIRQDFHLENSWCCLELKKEIEDRLSEIGFKTILSHEHLAGTSAF